MEMRKMQLALSAGALALSLALAGCGGGGSSGTAQTPPQTNPPPPTPAETAAAALVDLQASTKMLAMLVEEDGEGSTLKMAMDASMMLTTTQVAGDSSKAMMSAEMVLEAKMDLEGAIMDAEDAIEAAEDAKDGINDDGKMALDNEIADLQAQIKAGQAILNGDDLKMYVDMVTGGENADPEGTPRSIANMVGMDIAGALAPGTVRGATRLDHGATKPGVDISDALKFETDDHQGMTWAMIVGEANVMTKHLGTDNAAVQVASIEGMTASTSIDSFDPASLPDATGAAGSYMGIAGTVYCLGDDCKVGASGTADEDKLVGSWYFEPTSPMAYYVKRSDNPETKAVDESQMYEAELYASYGHWLTSASTPLEWTVNTFATSNGTETPDVTTVGDADNGLVKEATYSGKAAGMSVYKSGDNTDSGKFTADVMLMAKFGASPTVSGTIDNFMGDAVGDWSVTLESTALQGGSESEAGPTTASGRDGQWTAQAYGEADKRPEGVFGSFNAHFSDGHAAGAYATRMMDK